MKKYLTAGGREHGLLKKLANSVKEEDEFKNITGSKLEDIKKKKKDDSKLISARYLNREGDGEELEKPYCKYAGEPIQMWRFIHDYEYEVPKGLVEEVNEAPPMKQRSQILDAHGVPARKDSVGRRQHKFVPVGF